MGQPTKEDLEFLTIHLRMIREHLDEIVGYVENGMCDEAALTASSMHAGARALIESLVTLADPIKVIEMKVSGWKCEAYKHLVSITDELIANATTD